MNRITFWFSQFLANKMNKRIILLIIVITVALYAYFHTESFLAIVWAVIVAILFGGFVMAILNAVFGCFVLLIVLSALGYLVSSCH